ncbi:MAG: pth [Alphaproteobacteria bacterium]|nr:pth [Alphaproteobacteria bacterium]
MSNWLIVGLGNPGRDYAMNRHNIGFMALDALADRHGTGAEKKAFQSLVQPATINGTPVLLQKPQTYMNLSGEAVGAAARFFKIPVEKIIVLQDELAIDSGLVRIKQGGGHAGHNGLKSIDQHLGQNYWRIRLGIGHPGDKERVTSHVLGNFSREEMEWVEPTLEKLTENFGLMLDGQWAKLAALFTTEKTEGKNGL